MSSRYCATIGFFDGVHLGHRYVIRQLELTARMEGLSPLVVTFSNHPFEVLRGMSPKRLTTADERYQKLTCLGCEVAEYDFRDVYQLTAKQFITLLHNSQNVDILHLGYNQRFGTDMPANSNDYCLIGKQAGIKVMPLEEHLIGGRKVSSTIIRRLLSTGKIEEANRLLGYNYSLTGQVVQGKHIGRTIGFPTANLSVADEKLIPADGVYSATAVFDNTKHQALVNIGFNPTTKSAQQRTIEAHLINFNGDLYDKSVRIELEHFIREDRTFNSLDQLKQQIENDIKTLYH